MSDLHLVGLQDKDWINHILSQTDYYTCEYPFGNIFSYGAKMDIFVGNIGGCLVTKCIEDDYVMYCCPIGKGDMKKAVEFILSDAKNDGRDFEIFAISPASAEFISKNFPDVFDIFLVRDTFDYIYSSEDLINLSGKKYQPKRNHISYFMKNNNWSYETLTKENIPECLEMSKLWLDGALEEYKEELEGELKIIERVFDNYDELDYVGGLIRVDGKVVAYTMGEKGPDGVFCVHIEKAFADIRGAYPMVNQQFVKNELSEYKYINREDDTGAENLRKAKLSYYPTILAEKYEAKLKDAH
jgi:hypothetical protein